MDENGARRSRACVLFSNVPWLVDFRISSRSALSALMSSIGGGTGCRVSESASRDGDAAARPSIMLNDLAIATSTSSPGVSGYFDSCRTQFSM